MTFQIAKWGEGVLPPFVFIMTDGVLVGTDSPDATASDAEAWYTNQGNQ